MRLFNGSELSPPTLPPCASHGISLHAANHLSATIAPYPDMDQGDLVELFCNSRFVSAHPLQADDIGNTLQLPIPASFVLSGEAHLHYRVLRVGHRAQKSQSLSVPVKLDCPGGSLQVDGENQFLAPVQLPDEVCLNTLKRGIPFSIEPWRHMAALDCLTLRWGDLRLDLPPLHGDQVGEPIKGRIPKSMVREAGQDAHLEVTYCILDRVGNPSGWAPSRQVRVYRDPASIDIPKG
ncbi:hypothetical protein [Pseudomonas sp. TE3610]